MKWLKTAKMQRKNFNYEKELVEKCSVYYIPCDSIRPNAMRSRCDFDEDKLVALAYSIKKYGIIEPLCVRRTDDEDSYDFELISGERRLRAAKMAGFITVPCIIIAAEQGIAAELSLIENIYSESLNYFEIAAALKRIVELGEGSFEDLAIRLSITQTELLKKLWLLELDYNERQLLLNISVSEDQAVNIARIQDRSQRLELIKRISSESVQNIDVLIRDSGNFDEETDLNNISETPRDVNSVIKSILSKISFLNRRKKRAKIKLIQDINGITAEIRIDF